MALPFSNSKTKIRLLKKAFPSWALREFSVSPTLEWHCVPTCQSLNYASVHRELFFQPKASSEMLCQFGNGLLLTSPGSFLGCVFLWYRYSLNRSFCRYQGALRAVALKGWLLGVGATVS